MSLAICLADDALHQRQLEFLFYFLGAGKAAEMEAGKPAARERQQHIAKVFQPRKIGQ
jgi:hypothetical protein